jgi:hypothetical protein
MTVLIVRNAEHYQFKTIFIIYHGDGFSKVGVGVSYYIE